MSFLVCSGIASVRNGLSFPLTRLAVRRELSTYLSNTIFASHLLEVLGLLLLCFSTIFILINGYFKKELNRLSSWYIAILLYLSTFHDICNLNEIIKLILHRTAPLVCLVIINK